MKGKGLRYFSFRKVGIKLEMIYLELCWLCDTYKCGLWGLSEICLCVHKVKGILQVTW